jgi:hypothetical protein
MRQTTLSFDELLHQADTAPLYGYGGCSRRAPSCFFCNEIGEVFKEGGSDARRAEEFLRRMLDAESVEVRFVAAGYLSDAGEGVAPETQRALEAFHARAENAQIIALLHKRRARMN